VRAAISAVHIVQPRSGGDSGDPVVRQPLGLNEVAIAMVPVGARHALDEAARPPNRDPVVELVGHGLGRLAIAECAQGSGRRQRLGRHGYPDAP